MLCCLSITGTESDVVTNELRKRNRTPAIESNENEAIDADTISVSKPDNQEEEQQLQQPEEIEKEELSKRNDDKDTEPSESVKTHIDKKNE